LLAKLIVHADDPGAAAGKACRALSEFKIAGARNNISFLQALLKSPALGGGQLYTRYVEDHMAELLDTSSERERYFPPAERDARKAGVRVDPNDPLAVLGLKGPATTTVAAPAYEQTEGPDGTVAVSAPLQGMIISIAVKAGDTVRLHQPVSVMEALKMEHVVTAEVAGIVREVALEVGDTIFEGTPILFIEPGEVDGVYAETTVVDLDSLRPDVAEIVHFHQLATNAGRSEATAKRHAAGKRTAHENILDLCDPGSFVEYGPIVTAARLRTDTLEDLEMRIDKTGGDAMNMGVGRVNGDLVGRERARCIAMSYDYTVLAGTQGSKNHQ